MGWGEPDAHLRGVGPAKHADRGGAGADEENRPPKSEPYVPQFQKRVAACGQSFFRQRWRRGAGHQAFPRCAAGEGGPRVAGPHLESPGRLWRLDGVELLSLRADFPTRLGRHRGGDWPVGVG